MLDGRYRLRTVLGRGGTATVWRADDLRLQRPVAVKVLGDGALADPDLRERLRREAHTLARLAHPGIVAVHDVNVTTDPAYLVMELVAGPGLDELLTDGPLPVPRAVAIATQVGRALAAAHGAGILHRDIKPANLIITPTDTVKVCDFGIAQTRAAATLTESGSVLGTSAYLAPERATGEPGDHRADLYALGCVLYEMVTGTPPFTGPNQTRVLNQHLHQPPRPLAEVRDGIPAELDHLVLDLLAKHPDDRPASAAEVVDRLAAVAYQNDTVVLPAMARGHRRADRSPGRWIAAAVVAALVLGGLAAVLRPTARPAGSARQLGPAPASLDPIGSAEPPPSPSPPSSMAPAMPRPAPTPSPPASLSLPARIAALDTLIARESAAGQLDAQAAGELRAGLNDVTRRLGKGQTGKAVSRVAQLRDRLTALAQDARLSSGGLQILAAAVDKLATALAVGTAQ
jgi:serine/threonine-protein kinase